MSQTIRQRRALNGSARAAFWKRLSQPMAYDLKPRAQPPGCAHRVLCERDLKPGRDEPTVLRLQPRQERQDLPPRFDPSRRLPWPLFAVLSVYVALVLAAISILPLL